MGGFRARVRFTFGTKWQVCAEAFLYSQKINANL
jgi:hypothetical protein